jgi:hypothetical protein
VHEGEILKGSNFDRESRKCYYIVIQKSLVIGLGASSNSRERKETLSGMLKEFPEKKRNTIRDPERVS